MKLLYKNIDKKNCGSVTLIAEEAEDMWHAYNLINIGDNLRSSTIRQIVNESAGGLTTKNRVHTMLTISVKSLDFDTQASVLRVKGTNIEENQFIKMGAYHTIDLELNRKFTIEKSEWDSVALSRIDEACDPSQNAELAAIIMQEGLANICLITSSMTLVKAKIEMNIPRKRKGLCANHDKNMEKFYDRIIQALLNHIKFDIVKAIIIASPGFLKDQFFEYMNAYAVKITNKILIDNKSKFVLVHSASGFKHSLKEIFEDPNLGSKLTDTKALGEVKALESFYQMLKTEPSRAFYGYKHVEKANEADAIDVLLISDSLFRSKELAERKKYVNIVDKVKENNGQVKIFSSLHVSGEQLLQLTGIAAILRFPMVELEDELLSDSDNESEDSNKQDEKDFENSCVSLIDENEVNLIKQSQGAISNATSSTLKHASTTANFNKQITSNFNSANSASMSAIQTKTSQTSKTTKSNKKYSNYDDYDDDDDDDGSRRRDYNYKDYDDYDDYDF